MSKKILTQEDKEWVAKMYSTNRYTEVELSEVYNCSRRTIYRARLEFGLVNHRKATQAHVTKKAPPVPVTVTEAA